MTYASRISTLTLPSLAALLIGCSSGAPTGPSATLTTTTTPASAPLAAGGATNIYLVASAANLNGATNSILQFSAASSAASSPVSTLTPPPGVFAYSVATDSQGQIYVGGFQAAAGNEILVYAAGATGSATPLRTILITPAPNTMVIGPSGSIYIASTTANLVAAYPSTATGTATPLIAIQGAATLLSNPAGVAVDASGNIYVTNNLSNGVNGYITVFASGATGNVAPARMIDTGLGSGVALDASGNIYASSDGLKSVSGAEPTVSSVVEYPGGLAFNSTPIKILSNSALNFTGALRVDAAGNLYVVNSLFSNAMPALPTVTSVLGFGPAATGNTPPAVSFTSTSWNDGGSDIALN